jgi:hypothetical protein
MTKTAVFSHCKPKPCGETAEVQRYTNHNFIYSREGDLRPQCYAEEKLCRKDRSYLEASTKTILTPQHDCLLSYHTNQRYLPRHNTSNPSLSATRSRLLWRPHTSGHPVSQARRDPPAVFLAFRSPRLAYTKPWYDPDDIMHDIQELRGISCLSRHQHCERELTMGSPISRPVLLNKRGEMRFQFTPKLRRGRCLTLLVEAIARVYQCEVVVS